MSGALVIARANRSDLPAIVALLDAANLPSADITLAHIEKFFVAREGDLVVGAVGAEIHAGAGLLRSLVVTPAQRGRRLGEALVHAIEAHAVSEGIESLTLLTTTAAPFFERLGYHGIDRHVAPAALRATAEFARLCPASATCMSKRMPRP